MQITFENAFDSKQNSTSKSQQKSSTNVEKFANNRFNKQRIYVVDETDEKSVKNYLNESIDENEKQSEYYTANDNLKYYNIQKNNYNEKKKIFSSISRLLTNLYHVVVVVEKQFHLTMIYIVTFELIVKNY